MMRFDYGSSGHRLWFWCVGRNENPFSRLLPQMRLSLNFQAKVDYSHILEKKLILLVWKA